MKVLGLILCITSVFLFVAGASVPTVIVKNGTYSGIHSNAYTQDIFPGIPYAQSTRGQNRFRKSLSLNSSFTGIRAATSFGFDCPRYHFPFFLHPSPKPFPQPWLHTPDSCNFTILSFLFPDSSCPQPGRAGPNIARPANAKNLHVAVWI